ncbi:phytoene desaturase family protein [Streptomyces sp. NPDC127098]|uniref:phytoene desaturase family protein n=1 Tax=Streptomyces sp. NPDC127098 TaxID=3347137 RepID=UPI00365753CA
MRRETVPWDPGRRRVIIVGGGIAGLATGCYTQMSGLQSHIFEKHVLPGGCCTAWARDGYLFDYCIEYLNGTLAGNEANQLWRELGALDGKTTRTFEVFNRVEDHTGRAVNFYTDPDRLESHLLELSPVDAPHIRAFCRYLRRFAKVNINPLLKPKALMSPREKLQLLRKVLPALGLFWRTAATQMDSFTERLRDPLLRRAFPNILLQDHEVFPLLPYLFTLAEADIGNIGFPQGGSLGMARSIEERYTSLGGNISYRARVVRILVENDRAVGVELKDGSRHFADHVVSACDGHITLDGLLEGRYASQVTQRLYREVADKPGMVYRGVVSAFVGLSCDVAPDAPHSTTHLLSPDDARRLPSTAQDSIVVQLRSRYADDFAPEGKSVIHCTYLSDYDYWKKLRTTDRRAYWARKREVAAFVRDFLDRRHPGVGEHVEVTDVATPVTTERYTGNHRGAILGWMSWAEPDDLLERLINKERLGLPGLRGFTMAGQWAGGGALIKVAASGRFAAQYLCEELGVPFRAWDSPGGEPWHPKKLGHLPQLDNRTA